MDENQDYLSIKEIAHLFGKDRTTVEKWIKLGKIPHKKTGRNYLISVSELIDCLELLKARADQITAAENRDYVTTAEFAEVFRIHVKSVRRWIKDGSIPALKVGKRYQIQKTILDQWKKGIED